MDQYSDVDEHAAGLRRPGYAGAPTSQEAPGAEASDRPITPQVVGTQGSRTRYVVGTVDEIPPGGRKLIEVDGRSIGVFNVNGEYFALRNRCPHQGGQLCKGRLAGVLISPLPGEFELTRPGEILRCPWHGWEFDIRTGQSWFDPRGVRVRRYDVSVEPGAALAPDAGAPDDSAPPACAGPTPADLAAAAGGEPDSQMGGLAKGPYVAETYPVSVEQQYIVVELGGASAPRPADGGGPTAG